MVVSPATVEEGQSLETELPSTGLVQIEPGVDGDPSEEVSWSHPSFIIPPIGNPEVGMEQSPDSDKTSNDSTNANGTPNVDLPLFGGIELAVSQDQQLVVINQAPAATTRPLLSPYHNQRHDATNEKDNQADKEPPNHPPYYYTAVAVNPASFNRHGYPYRLGVSSTSNRNWEHSFSGCRPTTVPPSSLVSSPVSSWPPTGTISTETTASVNGGGINPTDGSAGQSGGQDADPHTGLIAGVVVATFVVLAVVAAVIWVLGPRRCEANAKKGGGEEGNDGGLVPGGRNDGEEPGVGRRPTFSTVASSWDDRMSDEADRLAVQQAQSMAAPTRLETDAATAFAASNATSTPSSSSRVALAEQADVETMPFTTTSTATQTNTVMRSSVPSTAATSIATPSIDAATPSTPVYVPWWRRKREEEEAEGQQHTLSGTTAGLPLIKTRSDVPSMSIIIPGALPSGRNIESAPNQPIIDNDRYERPVSESLDFPPRPQEALVRPATQEGIRDVTRGASPGIGGDNISIYKNGTTVVQAPPAGSMNSRSLPRAEDDLPRSNLGSPSRPLESKATPSITGLEQSSFGDAATSSPLRRTTSMVASPARPVVQSGSSSADHGAGRASFSPVRRAKSLRDNVSSGSSTPSSATRSSKSSVSGSPWAIRRSPIGIVGGILSGVTPPRMTSPVPGGSGTNQRAVEEHLAVAYAEVSAAVEARRRITGSSLSPSPKPSSSPKSPASRRRPSFDSPAEVLDDVFISGGRKTPNIITSIAASAPLAAAAAASPLLSSGKRSPPRRESLHGPGSGIVVHPDLPVVADSSNSSPALPAIPTDDADQHSLSTVNRLSVVRAGPDGQYVHVDDVIDDAHVAAAVGRSEEIARAAEDVSPARGQVLGTESATAYLLASPTVDTISSGAQNGNSDSTGASASLSVGTGTRTGTGTGSLSLRRSQRSSDRSSSIPTGSRSRSSGAIDDDVIGDDEEEEERPPGEDTLRRRAEVYARATRTIGAVRVALMAYEPELPDEMEVLLEDPILIECVYQDGINSVVDDLRRGPSVPSYSSSGSVDWNRHRGVGATLLENWVEERAVGEKILDERSSIARLSKQGHGDILTHREPGSATHDDTFLTTNHATYDPTAAAASAQPNAPPLRHGGPHNPGTATAARLGSGPLGKRRAMIEAELLKKAMEELKESPTDRSAKEWISTAHNDYGHGQVGNPRRLIDKTPFVGVSGPHYGWDISRPDEAKLKRFETPITFWSDHATKGAGTVICSSKTEELEATHGARFGRHAAFSTPITEYLKGEVKNV
ncbi:hypothetical protein HDU96_002554 [Phlyctochytrium bullatum]|nr:hypothetical protein HDU96_002554 [Phlyctochytrium bullatum]